MGHGTVLITGIGGFVGPYLADELLHCGYKVCGTYFAERPGLALEGECMLRVDITNPEEILNAVSLFRPDYVVHLAALSDAGKSFSQEELYAKVNVGGTRNLYAALVSAGIRARVLLIGSSHQYGIPKELPVTERHPLNPNNPYGKSKVEAELVGRSYLERIESVFTRSFNHTGPGQTEDFVLPSFAAQIARIELGKQEPVIRVGNIDAKRDFLDVRDVVKAYRLLLEKGKSGEAYNVCSGVSRRISDILVKMINLSSAEIKIKRSEGKLRKIDIPEIVGSNSKLKEATGWAQEIPFGETLKALLDYWRLMESGD